VVNLAVGVVLLTLGSQLASCSSSRRLVGALSGEMTTHATLETRPPNLDLLGYAHYAKVALRGGVPVAGFVGAASVRPGGSAAVMFTTMEHLASAAGIAAIASEIGDAAFASASACDSSGVA
jgi:hypothetical protein